MKTVDEVTLNKIKAYYSMLLGEKYVLPLIAFDGSKEKSIMKDVLTTIKESLKCQNYFILDFIPFLLPNDKAKYINYYLKHNLSIEELELIKKFFIESMPSDKRNSILEENKKEASSLEKNKLIRKVNDKRGLSNIISNAESPIIIYDSGTSELTDILNLDMFHLKKFYQKRNVTSAYDYACSKCNSNTIQTVLGLHRQNFEALLSLNEDCDIYALNAFLQNKMNHSYEKRFEEFILEYNEALMNLCREYQVAYINTRILEKKSSILLGEKSSDIIANEILKAMARNASGKKFYDINDKHTFQYDDLTYLGMMSDIYYKILESAKKAATTEGYERRLYLEKYKNEKTFELELFHKAYLKQKTK